MKIQNGYQKSCNMTASRLNMLKNHVNSSMQSGFLLLQPLIILSMLIPTLVFAAIAQIVA